MLYHRMFMDNFSYNEDDVDPSLFCDPSEIRKQFPFPTDWICPKCGREVLERSYEEFHCYVCGTLLFNEVKS